MAIEEVGLDDQGYLFVRPVAASADEFAQIYRAAAGITWNSNIRALHAYEPARWGVADLYTQIITAVADEYGVQLRITPSTKWSYIPSDLRTQIEDFDVNTPPR